MSGLDAVIAQAKELFRGAERPGLGPVSHRKMFGGAGLYQDGDIFALVAFDEIYLKADAALAEALEAQGARQFVYEGKGKAAKMRYWTLPDAALDDPDLAVAWAERALAAARGASG